MYDYHIHSSLSFDTDCPTLKIAEKAAEIGLKEICFTDHFDYFFDPNANHNNFTKEEYGKIYDNLSVKSIKIKRGIEFGLTPWNVPQFNHMSNNFNLDFIIGSVHYLESGDPYIEKKYWQGITVKQAYKNYLKGIYDCVKVHNNFNVLGHLTYVCKCPLSPTHEPLLYKDFSDITDEIFKILIKKGIGLEINTSGVDSIGGFLPDKDFLIRFRELGGEIISVGSDSHDERRVGQYIPQALEMIKDIFGYICTFENRKPIFNKL